MPQLFIIHCDETCHLPHDGLLVMGFAAVTCPAGRVKAVSAPLVAIKTKYRPREDVMEVYEV